MKKGIPTTYFIILILIIIGIVVLITTDIPSKILKLKSDVSNVELQDNEAMFLSGGSVRNMMTEFSGVSNGRGDKITKIKRSSQITNQYMTYDNEVSTYNSNKPIYMWFENGTIYWYTEATKVYLNPNSAFMFNEFEKLKSIPEFDQFDTSKVTNMESMFDGCKSLETLDLSNFNTSKVTLMTSMFENCKSLTNLNLSNFNTSNVTDMSYIFDGCESLTNLNLSSFNTSKVTNMESMFSGCSSLTSLNLSSFNTSKVTDMSYMFYNCQSLKTLNLSSFNTSKVTNMSNMFSNCVSLTNLDLSSFDTKNVTNMEGMFEVEFGNSLISLIHKSYMNIIIGLENFNTSKVTNMSRMFEECESLTSLDLSSFDTSKVTNMLFMFEYCRDLEIIYVSNKFVTDNVTDGRNMFYSCENLVGENGTTYSYFIASADIEYAKIDSVDKPGYFTGAYRIIYHGAGGTYKDESSWEDERLFKYGQVYPESSQKPLIYENFFIRSGYTFKGWNTKADGTGYAGWKGGYIGNKKWEWHNGEYGIGEETQFQLDLYVQWEPIKFTVKFDKNDASASGTMSDIIKTYNSPLYAPKCGFTKEGYILKEWNTESDGSGITIKPDGKIGNLTKVDGNTKTLYAIWEEEQEIDISKLDIRDNQVAVFNWDDSLSSIKAKLSNNNVILKDKNGNTKENGNLATNDKLVVGTNTYDISVQGDVSGDGEYTIVDVVLAYRIYKNTAQNLTDAQILAAKVFGTDKVTIRDITKIYRIVKGNN